MEIPEQQQLSAASVGYPGDGGGEVDANSAVTHSAGADHFPDGRDQERGASFLIDIFILFM